MIWMHQCLNLTGISTIIFLLRYDAIRTDTIIPHEQKRVFKSFVQTLLISIKFQMNSDDIGTVDIYQFLLVFIKSILGSADVVRMQYPHLYKSLSQSGVNQSIMMQFEQKPSKMHRVQNMRHAKHSQKQYLTLCKWDYSHDEDALHKFNFKKTTAFKKKYSCGGYGGQCSMCRGSRSYHDKTKPTKYTIECGSNKVLLCLPQYKVHF